MIEIILYRVLLRTACAAVVPYLCYIAYFTVMEKMGHQMEYLDFKAQMYIFLLAVAYPFNTVWLWLLIEPIQFVLDWLLKVDSSKNVALKGNFAPIRHEHKYEILKTSKGQVPTDVNGVFFQIGPNPQFISKNGRHHLFDGDGMVHAMRLSNGTVSYCNRYLESPRYLAEKEMGGPTKVRAGELSSFFGCLKLNLFVLSDHIWYRPWIPVHKDQTPNTATIHHGSRLFALHE